MNEVQALLARCRELGAEFTPTPEGKLRIKAPAPLPEELREALKQHRAEVLALLSACRPHISDRGELIIPFDCHPRYHYWRPGGQSLARTLAELEAPPEVWRRYIGAYSETVH